MILWLNPVSGLSGDMLLAALIDLGAPVDAITAGVSSTGLTGFELVVTQTSRQGVRACAVEVVTRDDVADRRADELVAMVGRASPSPVAALALRAIRALAEVEAGIHAVPVTQVHLHELGGLDTVVDIVGVAAALHALGVTQVWSAPLRLGAGLTSSAHGLLPVPAPATLALLRGVPVVGIDTTAETVTPTGAALLHSAGTRYGPMPAMTVDSVGYGAGTRDLPGIPNVLPALLGVPLTTRASFEPMTLVETTVDDVTGEVLGQLIDRLLDAGALDAWLAGVIGKKGRPAHVITALCREDQVAAVEETLLRETGSLGVRRTQVQRRALPRSTSVADIDGAQVRVKSGPYRRKPEFDDLQAAARDSALTVRELADVASAQLAAIERESQRSANSGGVATE